MDSGCCANPLWCLLLAALLLAVQASGEAGVRAEVKPYGGAPCLFVNGQPYPGLMGNASPGGDVEFDGQQCVVEALGSVAVKTARRFSEDLVVAARARVDRPDRRA